MHEKFVPEFAEWIKNSNDLLFPSPKFTKVEKKRSRCYVYKTVRKLGSLVGLTSANPNKDSPSLYLHWFRSQRLMQLGNEYGYNGLELKAFTGIVLSETLDRYAKMDQSARRKMGLTNSNGES